MIHKQCFFDTDMIKVVGENFSGYAIPVLYFFHDNAIAAIGHGAPMTSIIKYFGTVKWQDIVLYWKIQNTLNLQVTQNVSKLSDCAKVTKGYTKETMTTVDNVQYFSGSQSPSIRNRESRTFRKELKIIYHQRFHCRRQYLLLLYYNIIQHLSKMLYSVL